MRNIQNKAPVFDQTYKKRSEQTMYFDSNGCAFYKQLSVTVRQLPIRPRDGGEEVQHLYVRYTAT